MTHLANRTALLLEGMGFVEGEGLKGEEVSDRDWYDGVVEGSEGWTCSIEGGEEEEAMGEGLIKGN